MESVSTQNNGLRTYRPPLESYVFGNDDFKKRVMNWKEGVEAKKVSRALLLQGDPGLGKTTLALALCDALGAQSEDIQQVNCASTRTLEDARELLSRINYSPVFGDYRVLLLDEVQQMVQNAQQAFLTPIENLPDSTLLIACTSAPELLNRAFRSRFYEIGIDKYSEEAIIEALENLPNAPKPKEALLIARAANGNMRKAIDLAEGGLSPEDQTAIKTINAIEMVFPLLIQGNWPTLMIALSQIQEGEKRQFFEKTLTLLEGAWLTKRGFPAILQMHDLKVVTETLANAPDWLDHKMLARFYRELSELQFKPIQAVKGWVMGLSG